MPTSPQTKFFHRPQCPPNGDYIMAIEHACLKLKQGKTEELRVEVKNVLKKVQFPRANINREEIKAMKELKEDDTRNDFDCR